ncbi:MAG: FtsX-like permease family protein [Meiothermus sp.]|nr:FtsX-like permease family protein [Meiothermus sp.]
MWALAWRNIWRQKSRSLITAVVVGFVVASSLAYFGLLEAFKNGMFQRLTENAGHISVRVQDYREIREFDRLLIRDAARKQAALQASAQEAEVKAILEVPVLLAGEARSRGVGLLGESAPTSQLQRFSDQYLAEGRLPHRDSLEEIALGRALAKALDVKLGGTVYAFALGTEGVGAMAYRVVGLLDLPEQSLEARFAYLPLPAAQELAAPGAVTEFQIYLPELRRLVDEVQIDPLQARLSTVLGRGLSVEHWREANPSMASYISIIDPVILLFDALFFLLAGLLLVNTIYLGLMERIREFGIIIALGATRFQVMGMVMVESLALVLSGGSVGFVLGLALVWRMSKGFSLPNAESYAEFGTPLVMYGAITAEQVLITLAFILGTAILAALWPAWVAGRLQPVEAMRHVA